MTKKILLLSICCILLGTIGCGQTGDLYLPTNNQTSDQTGLN